MLRLRQHVLRHYNISSPPGHISHDMLHKGAALSTYVTLVCTTPRKLAWSCIIACMLTRAHACTQERMHPHVPAHIHVDRYMRACTCTCMRARRHFSAHHSLATHTLYIHTCAHILTRACVCACALQRVKGNTAYTQCACLRACIHKPFIHTRNASLLHYTR